MPSWNIHTAQVERLLGDVSAEALGIGDTGAFLLGNYAPDIYVGYMVPDADMRIDYRITHMTPGNLIPLPHADAFWDDYVVRWTGSAKPAPVGSELSLTLGAWAHLVCDRCYNGHFRRFWQTHDMPTGDALRIAKQADFDLFGKSLQISAQVQETPELLEAADAFGPYRLRAADVRRAIAVANAIVRDNARLSPAHNRYQLLSATWMNTVFEACNERLLVWLQAWQRLAAQGSDIHAKSVRAEAGLPPATPDDPNWMQKSR